MAQETDKLLLITGGAGFIGSHFVGLALGNGYRVLVLDALTYAGHRANLREYEANEQYEFVQGDITDAALVMDLLQRRQPDAVLNFAAESHVDRSISGPMRFLQTNVVGTATLLNAVLEYWQAQPEAARSAFRYLQVSTDEVFGSLGERGYFTESSPMQPNSPYSATKAGADMLVRAWHHTYGLPTITTHCSNNYGARQYPEKLIPTIIRCAVAGEGLPVYGAGKNVRDWIHVADHCAGVMSALERGRPGEVYCFGGDNEWVNIDLVREICSVLDQLHPRPDGKPHAEAIEFVSDRPGHDQRYAIDSSHARQELGFKPTHDFKAGLRDTVQWYLDNTAWSREVMAKGEKE